MRPEVRGDLKLPERGAPEGRSGGRLVTAVPQYLEQQYLPHRRSTNICLKKGGRTERRKGKELSVTLLGNKG